MASRHFSNIVGEFTGKVKGRLNAVNFSKLPRRIPVWKDFCEQRTTETVKEHRRWCERIERNDRFCSCHRFNPEVLSTHRKHMDEALKTNVGMHGMVEYALWFTRPLGKSKRTTLIDVSERRMIPNVL
jgi:hypothetical protein